jgi:hypothetical protein
MLAHPAGKNSDFVRFITSLPKTEVTSNLTQLTTDIIRATKAKRSVIFMLGAHTIKCGLSPFFIEMMRRGLISTIALNGAGLIHDFELALLGITSEDVAANLKKGRFGCARETNIQLNRLAVEAAKNDVGLGSALGKLIKEDKFPYREYSLTYNALRLGVKLTVHVAIGTDIIHQHPSCDGAAWGKATLKDFHLFIQQVSRLNRGVVVNVGSAVILPEVFVKALNVVRNLKFKVDKFTAANFDQIMHYRPTQNVLIRPTASGGKAFNFVGYHEIMIPLLYQLLIEKCL